MSKRDRALLMLAHIARLTAKIQCEVLKCYTEEDLDEAIPALSNAADMLLTLDQGDPKG